MAAETGTSQRAGWRGGWYADAHPLPSPNFGDRPAGSTITLIVVHSISLPPGEYEHGHVQALFTNQLDWSAHPYFQQIKGLQVSSHFFITRRGKLLQFVSCDHRAWHAGTSSFRGQSNCNDFSIGIEIEGLEGDPFELAQYRTLGQLCRELAAHYPINAVAGHEHISPGRKRDPGSGFDWVRLQRAMRWPASRFAALIE